MYLYILSHSLFKQGALTTYRLTQQEKILEMKERFEELIEGYVCNNVGVSEQFLPLELTTALQQNLEQLHYGGHMVAAGVGDANNRIIDKGIRRDKIYWIDNSTKNTAELQFITLVEEFIAYLNKTCYTGINTYEFHYAVYEPGSFYKRHRDQFVHNSMRKFSLVSYLNNNWLPEDGGNLLLYHADDNIQSVLPTNRKTVFFKSDEMEHEVAVANRPRMSITGWLKCI